MEKNATKREMVVKKVKETGIKAWLGVNTFATAMMLSSTQIHANSNTGSIDMFIDFVCDWLMKIGAVVAMVGGVLFAMGWLREDAEGKSRGLFTLMAGFMLVAIAQAPNIFGL